MKNKTTVFQCNKQHHKKVLLNSFQLNDHTLEFRPQNHFFSSMLSERTAQQKDRFQRLTTSNDVLLFQVLLLFLLFVVAFGTTFFLLMYNRVGDVLSVSYIMQHLLEFSF